ncbi:MAG: ribosome biogenesis/translation initiation ATPase RLI [Nitrosopumilus sp.]|uniref:Ribosome biogenesis/translation initiation ATPase RLI n=1 Tax=Nitrosopumilus zosterae TaxID=718286 RepID=A0A2S2KQJ3_9ARCH|nr:MULTISPECIES: ribosome biogenesis/translation initiation ATPase RLI [Nitrosopumilus]MCV0366455.1 ribosome biogenesis/translation initiation ATPase RLI [Nitrosopumilus sp.]BDQ31620.1 ribosome biogenesis/translation initiation ATPase RLI [Nitrosopumilus zosterae]GBH33827.1 ribosome biogenesis/translation initiation ATPase RLI [Nitrosopumilus zosterae]
MTHRVAVLDQDLCQPKKCGLECIKYCPVNKSGAECIVLNEESKKAKIDEDICNGCGICVKVCPFDAITIVNLASELATDKIHQYGANSFRLFKLPTPKKGEVVGLLGRNGMGKSTVVNILSGNLKPNLGRYENPPEWNEILKHYSGTELKQHFEKIEQKQIRASIKPQQVHHIAQAFDGTGKELLDKYDERGVSRDLIKELGLENSMEQSLKELSGGELQRIAVAAAASKDVEFYFFDEPSSYNDVFQRTGVARVIQNLAKIGKSVMVVEHDLTLLDFLSDYIEVLYGEPGAYGIVSTILSTKIGINVFLDGYLPNENVRFRDKKFSFDVSSSTTDIFEEGSTIVTYPRLVKKYPTFSVTVEAGEVRKGEVLGIMGANALGKTTMMKMIAGVEKPDSGSIDKKIKIAYKPQYLQNDIDVDVISVLDKANGNPVEGSMEEEQILEPLKIKKLYNKSIKNLSGGELQKIAVASCLLQKVDLYALDEPSAFLDVEDRIAVAKFIQKFVRSFGKSAIIIDHDLQLMDLISDSIVIFEGESGVEGRATTPMRKAEAMNRFLKSLDMSFRRDERSLRPRVNKLDSRLDKNQKTSGNFYYKH